MTPLFKIPSAVGNLANLFRQIFRNMVERTPRSSKDIRIVEGTTGWHAELTSKTKTTKILETGYPLEVFTISDGMRSELATDAGPQLSIGSHSWRRVFVREGYVNLFRIHGEAGSAVVPNVTPNPYPDEPDREFGDMLTGGVLSLCEIEIPEQTDPLTVSMYYIYIRATFDRIPNAGDQDWMPKGESCISAELLHSADPRTAHGWLSFRYFYGGPGGNDSSRGTDMALAMTEPTQPGVVYFLVAVIDAHAAWLTAAAAELDGGEAYDDDSEVNRLDIRQFQRSDINCPGPVRRQGDDDYEPFAITQPATEITQTSAILNATVDGGNLVTTVWFQYGLTDDYGHETARIQLPNGLRFWEVLTVELPVGSLIDALEPGQTYHFRVCCESSAGNSNGDDATFTATQLARAGAARVGRYPFKVYSLSKTERTAWGAPDPTGTGSWRKFFVSAGYANLVPSANTDECPYPDDAFTAANAPNLATSEIEVPENEIYYVYIEVVFDNLGVTHAEVWHSTDPTTDGWDDFALGEPISAGISMTPDPGAGPASIFYLIAVIDTKVAYALPTYNDDDENTIAYVRQFQRADINASVADALRLREYAVCVDDVTKYAILPSRQETDEPTL